MSSDEISPASSSRFASSIRKFWTCPISVSPVAVLKRRFRLRSGIPQAATTADTA